MFKQISGGIPYPLWSDERWKRLDALDRMLDGTFYDHLQYSFYDEQGGSNEYIDIARRRPSDRFNIPGFVSRNVSSKLFAGRHKPRLQHPNPKVKLAFEALSQEAQLDQHLLQAAEWGSVGAAAITYKVIQIGSKARACASVWRSKYCQTSFDRNNQLMLLRVQYVVNGTKLIATGLDHDHKGEAVDAGGQYWWTRDFTPNEEITYWPIAVLDDKEEEGVLKPIVDPNWTVKHNLGFVPAHWFRNPGGSHGNDGDCYWEPAVHINISIDYTLSQIGRACRYNASPELVVKGNLTNFDEDGNGGDIIRGPVNMLQFDADRKDGEGNTISGGEAYLLEMTGDGMGRMIEYVEVLKKLAMQAISGSRKDPDKMSGPTSGKALEAIDEEFIDLVQKLRTAWGDLGFLPMIKDFARTAKLAGHELFKSVSEEEIDALTLQWPRMYTPTAQEILEYCQGFQYGVEAGFIDVEKAKAFMEAQIDFPVESTNMKVMATNEAAGEEIKTTPEPLTTQELNTEVSQGVFVDA